MLMLFRISSYSLAFTLVCFELSDQRSYLVNLKTNQEKGNDNQGDTFKYAKGFKVFIYFESFI